MINGISHITLIVRDLRRTAAMLISVLDARLLYDSGDAMFSIAPEMFFDIGGVWLCIMQGDPPAAQGYGHIAFQVADGSLDALAGRIRAAGLRIRPSRPRVPGEGRSIYFYDYDNHLFELHAGTLAERLERYRQKP